jgi:hypothetical protein
LFFFISIIIQAVHPGAVDGTHPDNKRIDGGGIKAIFSQSVLHSLLVHSKLINIGQGICHQFQGHVAKGPVCEFDGKRPFQVRSFVTLIDAVQGRLMFVIIVGDIQRGTGTP